MNRVPYFDYIEEQLNILAERIKSRGRLNMLNLNNHAEVFYGHFLNLLYDWNLDDANEEKQNVAAIDLKSDKDKIVIQVSSTVTKDKIQNALKKDILKSYDNYTFKFISISLDADDLRGKTYTSPSNIKFNPSKDVIDKNMILSKIRGFDIEKQRNVYDFIRKELGNEIDVVKLESNLTSIIKILANENWSNIEDVNEFNPFEIERKITFNRLDSTTTIIHDYKVYHSKVQKIYDTFDTTGQNKSLSVLQQISKFYVQNSKISDDNDVVFLEICEKVKDFILNSSNFQQMEFETLSLCVDIIIVDAFIRCKIFKNPENYTPYAIT